MPIVNAKVTEEQAQRIRADAEAAGVSLSAWIRFCCLDGEPQPTRPPVDAVSPSVAREGVGKASVRVVKAPRYGCRSCGSAATHFAGCKHVGKVVPGQ